MGNSSNIEQWAVVERMRFIDRCAYWRGTVNRQDLARVFGLSMAQASADLQQYQQENPGALGYNLKRKRYEGTEGMGMKFAVPVLEEAMGMFLSGGEGALPLAAVPVLAAETAGGTGPQVYVLPMPQRRAAPGVERRVFLAVLHGWKIRVRYWSVSGGQEEWRWLHPRAFLHNGSRWHVRAWCEKREGWADFNLSRIGAADWPEGAQSVPVEDPRLGVEVLKFRASRELGAGTAAVERDYGMVDGTLEVSVPGVLADYMRTRLRVPLADGTVPGALLEEV